ncbi:MAG: fumarate hydratase [Candidatus Auribacterota bacterium]|jgi:fumarate hydratase subunit alpha|nr:fumarate hydratase [Candidatus Auribacterota bacterium]
MRTVPTSDIRDVIAEIAVKACMEVDVSVTDSFAKALKTETSELGSYVLNQLIDNYDIAKRERIPICQDTGMVTVFCSVGQDVHLSGDPVEDMINEGIRIGYEKGYLRKSVVRDPIDRVNTGDNTPAVIHYRIVPGDKVTVTVVPKGAGCENMSKLTILKPTQELSDVKSFVKKSVFEAGANACPPFFIGVGIGGNFEKVAILAKEAVTLPFTERSEIPYVAKLEDELLAEINELNLGPQGFGGKTTALGLRVLVYPTHIASLPVAVNISCHAVRHEKAVI